METQAFVNERNGPTNGRPISENDPNINTDQQITEVEHICVICYDGIEDSLRTRGANCTHEFHEACLVRWVRTQRELAREDGVPQTENCPLCRANLFNEESTDETGLTRDRQDELGEEGLRRPDTNETQATGEHRGHSNVLERAMLGAGLTPTREPFRINASWGNNLTHSINNTATLVRQMEQNIGRLERIVTETPRPPSPPTRGGYRQGRRLYFTRNYNVRPNRGRPYPVPSSMSPPSSGFLADNSWGRAPSDEEVIWNRIESLVRAAANRREDIERRATEARLQDLRELRRLLNMLGL